MSIEEATEAEGIEAKLTWIAPMLEQHQALADFERAVAGLKPLDQMKADYPNSGWGADSTFTHGVKREEQPE